MKEILLQRKLFASITKGDQNEARKSSALLENPSETFSETVSVSGVLMKYFSDYEELTFYDNCLEAKASAMPQFTPKTPPRSFPSMLPTDLSCKTSRNNIKRPDVGKHLVVASNKTGLCGRRDRKLLVPKSSSLVRSLLFEVSSS
ncbi:hypothetical protein C3L33_17852, partial [Rhododendron williamsianum]